jgi:hypothetical protein
LHRVSGAVLFLMLPLLICLLQQSLIQSPEQSVHVPRHLRTSAGEARAARTAVGVPASLLRRHPPCARRAHGCRAQAGPRHELRGAGREPGPAPSSWESGYGEAHRPVGAHYGLRTGWPAHDGHRHGGLFVHRAPDRADRRSNVQLREHWKACSARAGSASRACCSRCPCWHAWVGVRDIWMDYVKPPAVRLALQILTLISGSGRVFGWAVQILWSCNVALTVPASSMRSSSAPAAPACVPHCSCPKPASRWPCCPRCSRRARTPLRRRAASAPRWATWGDNWHWHMYDTVKGSDYLGDQDAIEFMCRKAPRSSTNSSTTACRSTATTTARSTSVRSAATSQNFGEKPVQRSCAAADRTGHAMLHTLYQRNVRANTQFFVEWMALDLIRDERAMCSASPRWKWRPARS